MTARDIWVSIIVPVYGTEAYLSACIDSLCKQTYPHIQIILVDDQSPDGCPAICDAYAKKDPRIQVIHQTNKGVSGARNTGMRVATGEYIMFVDSDDKLEPEAIEILLQDAVTYDADIVSSTAKMVDEEGTVICHCEDGAITLFREDESLLLSLQGEQSTEAVWAKLFRKDFLKEIRFEEGKNINEDGFFLFQCYVKQPIVAQHNVAIYQYNIRQNSCSRQVFSEKYLAMLYFMERKKEYLAIHYPQYADQTRNMEVRTLLSFLDVLCSAKGTKKNKELQKQSIQAVRQLRQYHKPMNRHHKQLIWIVVHGLYPIYKILIRLKYYQ